MTQTSRKRLEWLAWVVAAVVGAGGMFAANRKARQDAALEIFAISQARELAETRAELAQAEIEANRAEESAIAAIRDDANHPWMEINDRSEITDWNPGMERLTGWMAAEVLGQSLAIVMDPRDYEKHAAKYPAWMNSNDPETKKVLMFSCRITKKDGRRIKVEVRACKFITQGEKSALALVNRPSDIVDLTAEKANQP